MLEACWWCRHTRRTRGITRSGRGSERAAFWSFAQKIVFSKSINIRASNNTLANDCATVHTRDPSRPRRPPLLRPFSPPSPSGEYPAVTPGLLPTGFRAPAVMRPHRPKCIWQFLIIDNEPDRTTVRSGWKTMRRRLTEKPPPPEPPPSRPSRVCFSSAPLYR